MRTPLLLLTLLAAGVAAAQTPPAESPRRNQKIERTVIQDESTRIEEVKVGGQTESVKVQPKDAPAYEILPPHLARTRQGEHRGDGQSPTGGKRVWNVLSF